MSLDDDGYPLMLDEHVGFEETVVSSEDDPPQDYNGADDDGGVLFEHPSVQLEEQHLQQQQSSYHQPPVKIKIKTPRKNKSPPSAPYVPNPNAGKILGHEDFWKQFTGLKIKEFSGQELKAFEKPFDMGWRREVVLRGTVTQAGKKIGDVYYFGPNRVKLRSCVEMGLYLKKNPNCGLEPDNFTFARQPVYRPPQEVVRHAQGRGSNQPAIRDPSSVPPKSQQAPKPYFQAVSGPPILQNTPSLDEGASNEASALMDGRSKRKRVAPRRLEDEDYLDPSPFKKMQRSPKLKGPSLVFGTKNGKVIRVKPKMSPQLKQESQEQSLDQQLTSEGLPQPVTSPNTTEGVFESSTPAQPEVDGFESKTEPEDKPQEEEPIRVPPMPQPRRVGRPPLRRAFGQNQPVRRRPIQPKPDISQHDMSFGRQRPMRPVQTSHIDDNDPKSMVPPCSIYCGGGQLPEMLCSRCLCLFHKGCARRGITLDKDGQFVCPNCIQPNDEGKPISGDTENQQNGSPTMNGNHRPKQPPTLTKIPQISAPLLQSTLLQGQLTAPRSSKGFIPILPKPAHFQSLSTPLVVNTSTQKPQNVTHKHRSQLRLLQSFQQKTDDDLGHSYVSHHNRPKISEDSEGHVTPMVSHGKPLTRVPSLHVQKFPKQQQQNARTMTGLMSKMQHYQMSQNIQRQLQNLPRTDNLRSIAPIGPIKMTPSQVRILLDGKTKNKYRDWLKKYPSPINRLLGPMDAFNLVFNHLSVKDLVSLSMVSKSLNSLTSQRHLWQKVSLRNVVVNDWQYLGEEIIKRFKTTELDFDGVKIPSGLEFEDFWKNFSSIVPYLKGLQVLKFGSIPSFIFEEVGRLGEQLPELKSLSVKNVLADNFRFVEHFDLATLTSLKLSSKNGFKSQDSHFVFSMFRSMGQLEELSFLNLKDFPVESFSFLIMCPRLKRLEIGGCTTWTNLPDSPTLDESGSLPIPYNYMKTLTSLESLKLVELTFDKSAVYLASLLTNFKSLKSLTFEKLRITPEMNSEVVGNSIGDLTSLESLTVTTYDSTTNRLIVDFFRRLQNVRKLTWKVGVMVDDSGECFIQLSDEDVPSENGIGEDASEGPSITVANMTEQLEGFLPQTYIDIQPQ